MDIELRKILKEGIVIPAMPLALDRDYKLDEKIQRALVRYYLDAGAGGIAAAVHTTQFELRDHPDVFRKLLEVVANEIGAYETLTGKRIIKIGGICGGVEQGIEEAELLRTLGYDLGLVAPNAYGSGDELIKQYKRLGGIIPLFGFYLQSAIGGPELSYQFWKEVLADKNVVGIKIAPFDRYRTIDVMRAVCDAGRSDDLILYTGNDDSIVTDLLTTFVVEGEEGPVELNFSGGLLGHWCVWTEKAVRLFEEIKRVKGEEAAPWHLHVKAQRITDSNSAFFDSRNNFRGCIAGLHEVLRRQGFFDEIICYAPNGELSPGQKEEIDRVYEDYPELNDDAFVSQNISRWFD